MKIRNLVKRYSGLAKVADLICYSQTVNFAFIKQERDLYLRKFLILET